jgi:hypothetical protein
MKIFKRLFGSVTPQNEPHRSDTNNSAEGEAAAQEEIRCPKCAGRDVAPIVYGVPNSMLEPLFKEKKIFPGGAMDKLLTKDAPVWKCLGCQSEWRGRLFEGGPGDSMEHAVVIRGIDNTAVGIRAEKQYLTECFGLDANTAAPQPGWKLENQSTAQSSGRHFEFLTITLVDGSQRTVWFDITEFFGKWS